MSQTRMSWCDSLISKQAATRLLLSSSVECTGGIHGFVWVCDSVPEPRRFGRVCSMIWADGSSLAAQPLKSSTLNGPNGRLAESRGDLHLHWRVVRLLDLDLVIEALQQEPFQLLETFLSTVGVSRGLFWCLDKEVGELHTNSFHRSCCFMLRDGGRLRCGEWIPHEYLPTIPRDSRFNHPPLVTSTCHNSPVFLPNFNRFSHFLWCSQPVSGTVQHVVCCTVAPPQ